MKETTIKKRIAAELQALGVTGTMRVTGIAGTNQCKILRDGEYFGTFDIQKNVFTDRKEAP